MLRLLLALSFLSLPAVSQTHRFQVSAIAAMQSGIVAPTSTTPTNWYVRKDGGSRFSVNRPQGQCDGQADVAYPGTGINQHCALGRLERW
jgi:hypothetical protein